MTEISSVPLDVPPTVYRIRGGKREIHIFYYDISIKLFCTFETYAAAGPKVFHLKEAFLLVIKLFCERRVWALL